jgi:type I restriction enzyme S subunit
MVFNSNFLYHNLDNRYDELRIISTGSEGRGGLNLQIIKSLRINLPSLPEQQKIADCLFFLDDLIAAETQNLDNLKAHKKGLMQKLFPSVEQVKR